MRNETRVKCKRENQYNAVNLVDVALCIQRNRLVSEGSRPRLEGYRFAEPRSSRAVVRKGSLIRYYTHHTGRSGSRSSCALWPLSLILRVGSRPAMRAPYRYPKVGEGLGVGRPTSIMEFAGVPEGCQNDLPAQRGRKGR